MSTITVRDGTEIFFKEWGAGQPIVFHHGWPLSGDDWDTQMMFFADKGYRVIAHDRRGHGRSSPSSRGNDMDTYAADVAALALHLGLRNAVHIGHSTGGGEVIRYVAKYGSGGQVAKAVLIGAIPPKLGKSPSNPDGVPPEVIDGIRAGVLANRAQFYRDFSTGPFYGYNRPGATVSAAVTDNWFRQAMVGDIKAHYDCIGAFTDTDFTADLKAIQQPVLLMHGEDDQVAPLATTSGGGEAAQEWHSENLSRFSPRHGDDACRRDQRRHPGLPAGLNMPLVVVAGDRQDRVLSVLRRHAALRAAKASPCPVIPPAAIAVAPSQSKD